VDSFALGTFRHEKGGLENQPAFAVSALKAKA
jgi:hypothetical protein